ncbi:hypothetical protein IE81DRAFT_132772 [Ceraceosorus guamensis]|uniref:Uncharacterized protein n=1 Tax=Ceraceosorus guamensis TaxID=1522189 RepID=A0A316W8T3_9BASI|nr:hypothetical protein IE81DRAFT_132772 [Ceraceosorus guamensis]PWN45974.1 hypothetical protein IE81DRAFT_132772 [Ceraceosorus guamensis]
MGKLQRLIVNQVPRILDGILEADPFSGLVPCCLTHPAAQAAGWRLSRLRWSIADAYRTVKRGSTLRPMSNAIPARSSRAMFGPQPSSCIAMHRQRSQQLCDSIDPHSRTDAVPPEQFWTRFQPYRCTAAADGPPASDVRGSIIGAWRDFNRMVNSR